MSWQPPVAMPRNFVRNTALHPMLRASDDNALNYPPMYERINWRDLSAYPQPSLDEDAISGLPFIVLLFGSGTASLIIHTGQPNTPLRVRDVLVGLDYVLFQSAQLARTGGAINIRASLPTTSAPTKNTVLYELMGGNSVFLGLSASTTVSGFQVKMES